MNLDPARMFTKRMSFASAMLMPCLAFYAGLLLLIFFLSVIPSLHRGTTSDDFAVDSTVYIYIADSLRSGTPEPWVVGSVSFFPNTVWTPVFISYVLHNALSVMLLNLAIFVVSMALLRRTHAVSLAAFVGLILLNPTTTTSILCVNKEILDLLVISLFLYSRKNRRYALLIAALALAVLNRYELCVVLLVFLAAESRLNPFRERRITTLVLLVCTLNFVMPIWGAKQLSHRFEEAQFAGFIKLLDTLQMHYLYVLAVVPKIAEDLFGQLVNPLVWTASSSWLFINFFNNLAYAVLILIVLARRQLNLQNDLIYLGALGSVLIAQALVVQPRYFYFAYILLCLQAAQVRESDTAIRIPANFTQELKHA